LPERRSAPYTRIVPNYQLINYHIGNERMMPGFPAISVPRLRFVPYAVTKPMIWRDLSASREPRKTFYPEFSRMAGNGRGGIA
jgi:hypothetical protein